MKTLLRILSRLLERLRTPSIEEQYLAQAVNAKGSAGSSARARARTALNSRIGRAGLIGRRPAAYIGRNRWPKARLTFSGRCRPRTARL